MQWNSSRRDIMFIHRTHSATALASVLLTLVTVLPSSTWAHCACDSGICGAANTSEAQSCCGEKHKAAASEESAHDACCCTQPHLGSNCRSSFASDGETGRESSAQECGCSPSQPVQPLTSERSTSAHVLPDFGALACVAILPPAVELQLSPSDWAASLIHAPPVPVRERFCVWRK